MTQADLDREVADSTGESMAMVRRRGFSLVIVPDRKPRIVNWDAVQGREPIRNSRRRRRQRHAAA